MGMSKKALTTDEVCPTVSRPRESETKVRHSSLNGRFHKEESSSSLVLSIAKATRKPGINRTVVFKGGSGRKIYAYSVMPSDTSKIVREDASGTKTIGRLVKGQFKALKTKTA